MERERSAMREHDLIIGKSLDGRDFLCFGGGEHGILHARSGAGKSVGFSIPNAFAWPGSLVCLDIKRELFRHTAGYRASRGHNVILFDPAAPDGRSHRWNPFWQVDRESPDRFDQISRISFQIWPEALQPGTGNTDFWNSAGREAFCAVANLLAETTSEPLTMSAILRLFVRYELGHNDDGKDRAGPKHIAALYPRGCRRHCAACPRRTEAPRRNRQDGDDQTPDLDQSQGRSGDIGDGF